MSEVRAKYETTYWACQHVAEDIQRGAFKASHKGLEQIADMLKLAAAEAYKGECKVKWPPHNCQLE